MRVVVGKWWIRCGSMERREAMDGSATIAINRGMGEEQQGLRSIWRNGKDAKDCPSVPLKVKTFFNRELDRIRGKKKWKGSGQR